MYSSIVLYWLNNGWNVYKKNIKNIFPIILLTYIYGWIIRAISYMPTEFPISRICAVILTPPISAGFTYFCLKFVRSERGQVWDFLAGFVNFVRIWIISFIIVLIAFLGLILFVIPGVIWSIKYGMSMIIVLDRQLSPLKALKLSGHITKGHITKLFLASIPGLVFSIANVILYMHIGNPISNLSNPWGIIWLVSDMLNFLIIGPWMAMVWMTAYHVLLEATMKTAI